MSVRVGSLLTTAVRLMAATIQPGAQPQEPSNVIRGEFPGPGPDAYDVFISYCERDQKYLKRIKVHLARLELEGVRIYDKDSVPPGAVVPDKMQAAIRTAVVAILLISADYLASEAVQRELPELLDRAEQGWPHTLVLRVHVAKCSMFNMERLTKYMPVNKEDTPLRRLREANQDEIYTELTDLVRGRLIECRRYPRET